MVAQVRVTELPEYKAKEVVDGEGIGDKCSIKQCMAIERWR